MRVDFRLWRYSVTSCSRMCLLLLRRGESGLKTELGAQGTDMMVGRSGMIGRKIERM